MLYDTLIAPFAEFEFMRRALVGTFALAFGAPPIGVFLKLRRMSLIGDRSEERRVGKECRCRWSPCDEKDKIVDCIFIFRMELNSNKPWMVFNFYYFN